MTTGGGNMEAYNLDITTYGISSAAIRTDRGGKNVTVDGGNYNTKGQGSPSIYSTANISVKKCYFSFRGFRRSCNRRKKLCYFGKL